MHDLTIIITLAGALAVALVFGWITQRLGLSTLVGYLLAGIVVGPHTPGFVADARLASQMAEIGVILLLFGVGMHFHPQELLRVWRIAVPGAIAQSATALAAGWAVARAFGWTHGAGLVFGMALAVASTVVLTRMLMERDRLGTRSGHVAVGWLIVEDIFTVLALVMLPALAAGGVGFGATASALGIALAKVAVFATLVWAVGTRFVAPAIERVERTRSTELFTLSVFVAALGIAILAAKVFHLSVALGAFFAGLVVGQSRIGPRATADIKPFSDVFSALFFVSVGMLFDPWFVLEQPVMALAAILIVLALKPLVALVVVILLRDTLRTGLTVAVGLAQIGEFSFILAALGTATGVLPQDGLNALVVAAIVSIAVNPLLFGCLERYERGQPTAEPGDPADTAVTLASISGNDPALVIVAGSDELAVRIASRFTDAGMSVCIVVDRGDVASLPQRSGLAVLIADSGDPDVLRTAGLAEAAILVVAHPTLPEKMRACLAARQVHPRIAIVATAASAAEKAWLEEFGTAVVCDVLDEMADALLRSARSAL